MALNISDLETFLVFISRTGTNDPVPTDWPTVAKTLRAMIDDQAQLNAAMDAISAEEGEPNSKALADAAIALSDAALV